MKKQTEKLGVRLSRLSRQEHIRFFVSLAQAITITARGVYQGTAPESERIRILITLNEIQHQICGKLLDVLSPKPASYSDEAFFQNLFTIVGEHHREALAWDIEHALKALEGNASVATPATSD